MWLLAVSLLATGPWPARAADAGLPRLLQDTGLYQPDGSGRLRAGLLSFTPQYPLWSDGTDKRRWLWLPPGSFIDARDADAWSFPRGTRLWKEFSYQGRPVETRFIERGRDGRWRFASYVWNAAGTEAVLAPARGIAALPVQGAPGGRYAIPSRTDCLACHGSTAVPVLGASALQLSPDRDPLAPAAKPLDAAQVDLRALVARGWLRGLPARLLEQPPRIPADNPVERATLGYLHGNCAHCHNTTPQRAPLPVTLAQRAGDPVVARTEVLRSLMHAPSRYQPAGTREQARIAIPGEPDRSVLVQRMASRDPRVQMPPLGTHIPDPEGLALVQRWIRNEANPHKEP